MFFWIARWAAERLVGVLMKVKPSFSFAFLRVLSNVLGGFISLNVLVPLLDVLVSLNFWVLQYFSHCHLSFGRSLRPTQNVWKPLSQESQYKYSYKFKREINNFQEYYLIVGFLANLTFFALYTLPLIRMNCTISFTW